MKLSDEQTRCVFPGFVISIAVIFSFSSLWAVPPELLTQSFEVASGGLLKVRAERGSVEVTSGSAGQVQVEIVPKGQDLADLQDDFKISFDQTGNDVLVEIKRKSSLSNWFKFGGKGFIVYATVPFEFNVDLVTSGGHISVADLRGEVRTTTSGGNIRIENVAGEVDAKTSGGSVEATLLEQPEGDCYLGTSGGNVTVTLAADLRFDIDAKTSGGQVRTDLPISVRGTIGKTEVQGELNGGGPKLVLRTSGGNIRIKEGHTLH